jgi:hypothetical protein
VTPAKGESIPNGARKTGDASGTLGDFRPDQGKIPHPLALNDKLKPFHSFQRTKK